MSDLISRQAAIDAITRRIDGLQPRGTLGTSSFYNGVLYGYARVGSDLINLPSAEPEQKTGRWIVDDEYIDCSVCRREKWSRVPYESLVKRFRYCPNCGSYNGGERDGRYNQQAGGD